MRVLINGMQAGNQSGTGRYTEELIRHLAAMDGGPDLTVWWPADVPAPAWKDAVRLIPQRRGLWNRLQMERKVQRVLPDYDVVHYPASIGPLDGGPNVVVTVHDCIFLRHPEWFRWERAAYYRWAGSRSARRAARIIADSEATARDVRECMGIARDRIDVIPLGVDSAFAPATPEACAAARVRYSLPDRYFLYVGTLEPRKNLARLVRAWDSVAAELPEDLVIAGRDGWKTAGIHAAIQAAKHRDRIHLPGFIAQDDLPAVLTGARAFTWPSLYEGFGLPVLEAMACGTPVLTSNTSSLPEVTGGNALHVNPDLESEIADALRRLSNDESLYTQLATNGPTHAATFTWQRCAQATLAVYETAARGLPPATAGARSRKR